MKQGKIVYLNSEKEIADSSLEQLKTKLEKEKFEVVFAAEHAKGFFTLAEATLFLAQRGVKKISAFPFLIGEKYEIPLYWGIC